MCTAHENPIEAECARGVGAGVRSLCRLPCLCAAHMRIHAHDKKYQARANARQQASDHVQSYLLDSTGTYIRRSYTHFPSFFPRQNSSCRSDVCHTLWCGLPTTAPMHLLGVWTHRGRSMDRRHCTGPGGAA